MTGSEPEPQRRPRRVKVMAEYTAFPVWDDSDDVWNFDPDDLPISDGLRERLDRWNAEWEAAAMGQGWGRRNDRAHSAPEWRREGLRLARQLQRELDSHGCDIDVVYFHDDDRRPMNERE